MPPTAPRRPAFMSGLGNSRSAEPASFTKLGRPESPRLTVAPQPPVPTQEDAAPSSPPAPPEPPAESPPVASAAVNASMEQLVATALEAVQSQRAQVLGSALDSLRMQSERLAEQARSDALEVGFQVARRILEMEISASPAALFSLIRAALKRVGDSRKVTVRLSPPDHARVEAAGGTGAGAFLSVAQIQLVVDATLEPGDCLVETDFGTVDGRLSTRLTELRRAVDQELAEDVG